MLTPYMPQFEVATMDAVFALKRPARVLEFGAGGSTVRWSKLPFIEHWLTIEHDMEWYRTVSGETSPNAHLRLASSDNAQSYMEPVAAHGGLFDLIFVDGLHRVECVTASRQWLAPHGIVILHDIWQNDHARALHTYPNEIILGSPTHLHNGLLLMWGDE